jgi:hypothetical protein
MTSRISILLHSFSLSPPLRREERREKREERREKKKEKREKREKGEITFLLVRLHVAEEVPRLLVVVLSSLFSPFALLSPFPFFSLAFLTAKILQ